MGPMGGIVYQKVSWALLSEPEEKIRFGFWGGHDMFMGPLWGFMGFRKGRGGWLRTEKVSINSDLGVLKAAGYSNFEF